MPWFPPDLDYPREVAAAKKIEQEIVALDELARPARLDFAADGPVTTLVARDLDAGERNTVPEIHAHSAARLLDLAKSRLAIISGIQIRQMVAQTSAPAAARQHLVAPLGFRGNIVIIPSRLRMAARVARATARQLAAMFGAALRARHWTESVADRFAHMIPFALPAPTRIGDLHGIPVLLGVVNAELPAERRPDFFLPVA
jgi:hypothetical protein